MAHFFGANITGIFLVLANPKSFLTQFTGISAMATTPSDSKEERKDADRRDPTIDPCAMGLAIALAALREAQSERSRLDALLAAAPVGIIVADSEGKLIEFNPANRRIWGDAPFSSNVDEYGEWKGWWADGSERHGQRVQPSEWAMARALRGEEAPRDIVEVEAFGTGVHSIILNSGAPIRDSEHNIIGAVIAQMDITDRIKAEEALRQADRRKDQFIAVLAHELRNPLAPIRTALDIFGLMCPDDTMLQRAREVMERQLSHMTRLIDDLLDVARVSRGIVQLKKERCDLVQIMRRAAEDYRDDFAAHGIGFDLEVPLRPVWMNGDHTRLFQIISNLLHNAAKFTHNGDRVKLSLTVENEKGTDPTAADTGTPGNPGHRIARIEVSDTGEGMPPNLVPQLFAPFSQEQQDLGRSKGGLGLGLALVKGLTELHGGTVRVHSAGLGKGSTFTITLPLLADVQLPTPRPARPLATETAGLRVVVVEDNPDVLETLRMVMAVHNHVVTEATNGSEGIRAIRNTKPDVVVCDIGLPGNVDGYGVARAIRADPELRHIRLIALSGYGQDSDKQKSAAAGFDLHLVKPVPFRELEAAMLQKNPAPVQ